MNIINLPNLFFFILLLSACTSEDQKSQWINTFRERVYAEIKNDKNVFDTKASAKEAIHKMHMLDQEVRQTFIHNLNDKTVAELIMNMDSIHISNMKTIIRKYGWPTISEFGMQTDKEAWLLIQHADQDTEFQEECLSLLKSLIQKGETDVKNYAYLYDRVSVNAQRKQAYGTQVVIDANRKVSLLPYEGSKEDLNKRRKQIGLEPIDDYLEKTMVFYLNKGNGLTPEDSRL